jgi:hypothetical protein
MDASEFTKVRKVLDENPGDIPVIVVLNGKRYKSDKGLNMDMSVQTQLQNLFGKNMKPEY